MKKFSILTPLIALMLSGCSMMRSPAVLSSIALDYSEYQKNGFFITEATSVNFDYKPIASISAINISGFKIGNRGEKVYSDDVMGTQTKTSFITTTSEFVPSSQKIVLEELIKKAQEIGANAIINLHIKYINPSDGKTPSYGYEATAMAIRK